MRQQTESASEMLRKLIEAVEKAHTSLFAQCCSNPIKNAWGKEVSVAMLNDAQEMAVCFNAALRSEHPQSEQMALRLSDARILEIAMGHFKPGHTVAAEKNFLACVHDIFAQAASQPSAKALTDDVFLDLAGEYGLISPRPNEREWSAGFNAKLIAFATALLADHSRDVTKLAAEPSKALKDAANNVVKAWAAAEIGGMPSAMARTIPMLRDALRAAEQPSEDKRDSTAAARDVLAERRRQVEAEGWTREHDDKHGNGEMALAAGCYAANAGGAAWADGVPSFFPWTQAWWKPTTPRRDLVKAGALILAEIERIDRAEMAEQPAMTHTTPPCACVAYSLNKKDRA
ncbi:hypothetical protein [Cupriavidus basilensis]|uniref:DUF7181 domain-containing protein n=1 Tax=Cupriavidus basilensis TaxID=68895 RepID=UPI0039F6E70F